MKDLSKTKITEHVKISVIDKNNNKKVFLNRRETTVKNNKNDKRKE